jgi:hypothetical protein
MSYLSSVHYELLLSHIPISLSPIFLLMAEMDLQRSCCQFGELTNRYFNYQPKIGDRLRSSIALLRTGRGALLERG